MDKQISHEFASLMNKVKKLNHKYHARMPIHPGEFMMLDTIYDYLKESKLNNEQIQGIKVSELSELIHSTKPATSKMLKALEEKSYICRLPDLKDKRIVYICLTQEGEKIIYNAKCVMQNFINRILSKLGEDEAKEFTRLFNLFYLAMYDELNDCKKKKNSSDSI